MTGPADDHHLLGAVIALIIPDDPPVDRATRTAVHIDVTAYVASQIQSMPGFLRWPYQLALVAFNWLPLLRYGRRFVSLGPDAQGAYIGLWEGAPLGPMRDFVKLLRSCALLAYFDHPLLMEHLRAEREQPSVARQAVR